MSAADLERASDYAFRRLEAAGGNPSKLAEPLATVVIIDSAQGVIDNGWFRYFFESDFPGRPPYSVFVEAYRRIGAADAADAIEAGVAMLPFAEAHLHADQRNAYMDRLEESSEFFMLGERVGGNRRIWELLEQYCLDSGAAFREG